MVPSPGKGGGFGTEIAPIPVKFILIKNIELCERNINFFALVCTNKNCWFMLRT